jgi:hypothetical protein
LLLLTVITGRADLVIDWNNNALDAIRAASTPPPRSSRNLAITHAAIYDAVNGITRTHRPYYVTGTAPFGASKEAAVAAAAYTVLFTLYTNVNIQTTNLAVRYSNSLAGIPDGQAKTDGILWGQAVGTALLTLRASDGSTNVVAYTNAAAPGIWRPTPPANAAALLPGWGNVTPFALISGSQFRPQAPPPTNSSAYAFEVNMIKAIGDTNSVTRTADQTEIAKFWADGGGTATPPGHWNVIAQGVSSNQSLTLEQNARLFALLNFATADAAISCWDAKYAYNLWRPITAIREADTDGNAETTADPTWLPLIATPPFPEYTSGHSTFSRASATVLARFFGSNNIPFTTTSDGLPGVTRSFGGFSEAADESGVSRLYGGIHFVSGNIAAQACGHSIGNHVMDNYLQSLQSATLALVNTPGSVITFKVKGEPNRPYVIEATSDLVNWTAISTNIVINGEISFTDTAAAAIANRYYRAVAR